MSEFTHVCLDCGALGVAGGYHDHGGGNAGETIPLSSLPVVIRSFQAIEQERDELRAEDEQLRDAVRAALVLLLVNNPSAAVAHLRRALGENGS